MILTNIDTDIEIGIMKGLVQGLGTGIDIEEDEIIDREVRIVEMNRTRVIRIRRGQAEAKVEAQSVLRGEGESEVLEGGRNLPIENPRIQQISKQQILV